MKKRIVSFLLALVMAVSLLPVQVFAADVDTPAAEPAAVAQEPAKDEEPAQEVQPAETQQDEEINVPVVQAAGTKVISAVDELHDTGEKATIGGTEYKVYVLSINAAETANVQFKAVRKCMISLNPLSKGDSYVDSIITLVTKDDDNYKSGVTLYKQNAFSDKIEQTLTSGSERTMFYFFKGSKGQVTEVFGICIIEFIGEVSITDKTPLVNAIAAAPQADSDTSYYHENDRYNGKGFSKNGFWADYQAVLSSAKSVNESGTATQDDVTAVVADLTAAIANLIPADRANTTLLYEELQKSFDAEEYTVKSWTAYKTVRDKAEALMASMFDAEGNPNLTNNKAAANESIEKMAAELKAAREKLDKVTSSDTKTDAQYTIKEIQRYYDRYANADLSGYTAESAAALRTALTQAKKLADEFVIADMGTNDYVQLGQARRTLRKAAYGLETVSQDKIAVKVSVLDSFDTAFQRVGEFATNYNKNTYTGTMTLDANASAYDLLNSNNWLKRYNFDSEPLVFLNGELVKGNGTYSDWGTSDEYSMLPSIKLHNGDALTLVWIYPKQVEYSSQVGTYPELFIYIRDWFRYSTISAPVEVEAGKPFTIAVTSEAALPYFDANTRAVAGAGVYRSEAAATAEDAAASYLGVNTYAVTDATGKATITLYNEGYTLLNAFRLDEEGRYTVGASVLVHVTAPSDLSAVKAQLKKDLDAVYYDENYPESYFTAEQWQKVQDAYNTAIAAIDAAETSGAAGDAQQKAIQDIKQLQNSADNSNRLNLEKFRRLLNALPDDVTKLDATAEQQINDLKTCYEAMTGYQRGQLTGKEQKKYDAVVKTLSDGLAPAIQRKLTFKQQFDSSIPAADQAALNRMIAYLQDSTRQDDYYLNNPTSGIGGNMQGKLFAFSTRKYVNYGNAYTQITEAAALTQDIYACINPDYPAYFLCRDAAVNAGKLNGPGVISGDGWSISDESMTMFVPNENDSNTTRVLGHMTYMVNGKQYAIRSVTVSGLETDATSRNATFYDSSLYKGRFGTQCNQVVPDAFLQFTTGFNDVTVTVTWAPVDSDSVQAVKDNAISRLNTVKNGLTGDGVQAAYDAGVTAINAAKNAAEVDKAYQAAVKNMQAAATSYGKVRVIVENTTFPKSDWGRETYWYGEAVNTEVPLTADSTMMSCVVDALTQYGYTQIGAENNYISSITVDGYKLAEFDGGQNSGWMGTLNDWFTNEGFAVFTVAAGKLSDGDVIRIMYTRDLGVDLDGTWGNSDTTLKALDIQGGELLTEFVPGEAGGSYEYVLAIKGDTANVQLTPTAANRNYLTKIFLNEKVTDNAEGISFYKRTQTIPVKNGDVIYIGCGEYAWPSMNNQYTEARDYSGTWYALRVVNVNQGAGMVEDLINELPDVSVVNYSNYQQYMSAVTAARASYNALSKAQQKAVADSGKLAELEKLEEVMKQFQAIDEVKDKLDKLPNAGKLTIDDQEAVKAAKDAYDKLTDEQKEYLSFAQIDKMEKVTERMDEIIKENPTPTPNPGGNTSGGKKPSQSTGKDVKSGNTGDAGITLYLGMGLVAVLAGAVIITRKRKEN